MNPTPTQDWYDRMYAEEFWESKTQIQSQAEVHQNIKQWHKALRRAAKFEAFLNRGGVSFEPDAAFLEIGCAYGLIVGDLAHRYGATALGVEPSNEARAFARSVGVEMVANTLVGLSDWQPEVPVDMIMFSHVMENILDLDEVFATVRRVLGDVPVDVEKLR